MPKNTPLPMQWLTVDGQNIPIVLPDHWDDDKKEWKTTGTGNPLPIANYTQNASGVWLPTSESNPMPTQLTGSIVEDDVGKTTITAGSSFSLPIIDMSKYKFYNVGIRVTSSHDYEVTTSWTARAEGGGAFPGRDIVLPGKSILSGRISGIKEVLARGMIVVINNNSNVDQDVYPHIFKRGF